MWFANGDRERVMCAVPEGEFDGARLAEACLRLSPQIAMGDGCIFIEVGKVLRLHSEAVLLLRLRSILQRFGLRARVAVADDLATAKALAVFGRAHKMALPIEALQYYADPFRESDSLTPAVLSLKRLGISLFKDFMKIESRDLAARFGKDGVLARHYLETPARRPWPVFRPPERLIESEIIDESYVLRDFEPLLFLFKNVLDRVALRAYGRGRLVAEFAVRIEIENYSVVKEPRREWVFSLAFPQGSSLGLLSIVRERVERELQFKPLESPVRRIEVEVGRAVPSQGRQTDLFSKKEQEEESLRSLISRLVDKMGTERVFHAAPVESYFPERSWRRTLEPAPDVVPRVPRRPLRLLKRPVPLRKIDRVLVHNKKRWRITAMSGPERLAGDWWRADTERDYYRVSTESGEELWVFRAPAGEEYFLHGMFD